MVFGEPRNVEKFARMPLVVIRSDSKDMADLEGGMFWRGNGDYQGRHFLCMVRSKLSVAISQIGDEVP